MSRACEICGKGQISGNQVSHSNKHNKRKWNVNVQKIRVIENGSVIRKTVCTRCIRSNRITRAV
ncbi:MAG: 50S ribosomal protein L28 [Peptostreptococcales bacterium]